MHYVTPLIKKEYWTPTNYPPTKIRKTIFMRYGRQSVQKHRTKLTLTVLQQCPPSGDNSSILPTQDTGDVTWTLTTDNC